MLVRRALTAGGGGPPDDALLRSALEAFKRCYQEHLYVASRLYPGVPETLEALAAAGLKLGCATNKPEAFARELLDQAGIGASFDFIHGADSFATKKPSPEPLSRAAEKFAIPPNQAIMVGDSRNDLDAARAAGFDFVFAAYGYAQRDDPVLNAGLATIDSFAALKQLLCGS